MTVLTDQQATVNQGEETLLHHARFEKCRVVLTGASGEFQTIPFAVRRFRQTTEFHEASEVFLRVFQTVFGADVLATARQGVATLDIVYEIRTGRDA